MSRPTAIDPQRIREALAGDAEAMRELITVAEPIVRARAAWALARSKARRAGARHDLEDLTQDVFAALFESEGRALRGWDPALGLSFRNFIGLLTQRQVVSILRGATPMLPLEPTALEAATHDEDAGDGLTPERHVASRELLQRLWRAMRTALSARGLALFERLYLHGQSIAEVCDDMDMTSDAVYQWRHRLALLLRAELTNLEREHAVALGLV